ncbi:MAG: hypothetical protein LBS33_08925, partial [Streptococcaceae bacterium]|nr:hypothetical protein [Streptococcaceae bacterium]
MKNFKLTKRRVAGLAVVLAIASIGIFAGTYAKYVSTVDLGNTPDQNAQVAVWHVGEPISISDMFSPYYYHANAWSNSQMKDVSNLGHSSTDSEVYDTVFNSSGVASPENLVAPGTTGRKIFHIQDNLYDIGDTTGSFGSGNTEVSYTVKFSTLENQTSRINFSGDTNDYLKTHLRFKLYINDVPKTENWVNASDLNTALGNVTLYYDSAGLDDEVTIAWEWPFDDTDGSGTYDSSDVAAEAANAKVSVSFGTVRYEQEDTSAPSDRNGIMIFAGARWLILKQDDSNAMILRTTPLTNAEAGSAVTYSAGSAGDVAQLGLGTSLAGYFESDGSNNYAKTNPIQTALTNYCNQLTADDLVRVKSVSQTYPTFTEFKFDKTFDKHKRTDDTSESSDPEVSAVRWKWWPDGLSDNRYKTTIAESGSDSGLTAFVPTIGDLIDTGMCEPVPALKDSHIQSLL